MRATRFRCRAGLKTWSPREGSRALERQLVDCVDPVNNSIRAFGRDLTDNELESLRATNRGRFPERARKRQVGAQEDSAEDSEGAYTDEGKNPRNPRKNQPNWKVKRRFSDASEDKTSSPEASTSEDEVMPTPKRRGTQGHMPTSPLGGRNARSELRITPRFQHRHSAESACDADSMAGRLRSPLSRRRTAKASDIREIKSGQGIKAEEQNEAELSCLQARPTPRPTPARRGRNANDRRTSSEPDRIPMIATYADGQQETLLPEIPAGVWLPPWRRMADPQPITNWERAALNRVPFDARTVNGYQVVNGYWTDPGVEEEARRAAMRIDELDGAFFRSLRHYLKHLGRWQ